MITKVTKTFTVTLTCTVQTLTFSTTPASSTLFEVGVNSQPFYIPASPSKWALVRDPNCNNAPTLTLSVSPAQTCITNSNDAGNMTGSIVLNGCTLPTSVNTYSCNLTAIVDGKTATANFTIIIQDPCKRAIFDTVNPFTLITATMPTAGPTTSSPAVKTDLSVPYSITCDWTGSISPALSWIAYNSSTHVITITHSSITLPTDLGTHSFSITVDSTLWPSFVTDKVYTFDVLITCVVTTLTVTQQAANKNPLYINDPAFTTLAL